VRESERDRGREGGRKRERGRGREGVRDIMKSKSVMLSFLKSDVATKCADKQDLHRKFYPTHKLKKRRNSKIETKNLKISNKTIRIRLYEKTTCPFQIKFITEDYLQRYKTLQLVTNTYTFN
jgi:hypothetical protein